METVERSDAKVSSERGVQIIFRAVELFCYCNADYIAYIYLDPWIYDTKTMGFE